MDWPVYGAIIAGFVAVAAAAAYLVVQALQGWRAFKRLRRHIGKELERLAAATAETADASARASDQSRLAASLERMRIGFAQIAVLRNAVDEATDVFSRLAWVYPRK